MFVFTESALSIAIFLKMPTKTLICLVVLSRQDYCNCLLLGFSKYLLSSWQASGKTLMLVYSCESFWNCAWWYIMITSVICIEALQIYTGFSDPDPFWKLLESLKKWRQFMSYELWRFCFECKWSLCSSCLINNIIIL